MKSQIKWRIIAVLAFVLLVVLMLLAWNVIKSTSQSSTDVGCGELLDLEMTGRFDESSVASILFNLQYSSSDKTITLSPLNAHVMCFLFAEAHAQGYFLKKKNGAPIMLQAIHAHDDRLTGSIVSKLMHDERSARYGYISSVRRSLLDPSNDHALINDLSIEMFERNMLTSIIQLHGFSQKKRNSHVAKNANMIISSGSKHGTYKAKQIYKCLNEEFEQVYFFGDNVFELGGTTNLLNQNLLDNGFDNNFIHIELSLPIRRNLHNNNEQLRNFSNCLLSEGNHAAIN